MGVWGEAYLERLRSCAARSEREFVEVTARDRAVRLVEEDARTVEEAIAEGVLTAETSGRVRTLDPLQAEICLIEGDPAAPRWEALSHLATYVDLLHAGYPPTGIRFATSDSELSLDLAAVREDGRVALLGVVRTEPLELTKLEALIPTFEAALRVSGGRARSDRDAARVVSQLWSTRAPYLLLSAAGSRRVLRVRYGRTITLAPTKLLPLKHELWPDGAPVHTPRVVPELEVVAG